MQQRPTELHREQQGIVAIFTVLIVMGILTLLTIGFSAITRQAQRQTLDDQLSTQAFYAAETGINKAQELLRAGTVSGHDDCSSQITGIDYEIDRERGIGISCILITQAVGTLDYDNVPEVGMGESIVGLAESESGEALERLNFSWGAAQEPSAIPNMAPIDGRPQLLADASWGNRIGVVRVDLVPKNTSLNRGALVAAARTFFLYPRTGGSGTGTVLMGVANQGAIIEGNCSGAGEYPCTANVAINNPSSAYYVRLHTYYNAVRLRVGGLNPSGTPVGFKGGQAQIDVTGRVNDVSRRIQVRVPIHGFSQGAYTPFSILSADSICKRLVLVSNDVIADDSDTGNDPACSLNY